MYKIIICCLVALGVHSIGHAQKLNVGVLAGSYLSGGPSIVELTSVTGFELENMSSIILGVQGQVSINDHFSVGTAIIRHHLKFDAFCYCHLCDKFGEKSEEHIELIEIPVYLKTYLRNQNKKVSPYISTGLSSQFSKFSETEMPFRLNLKVGAGLLINITEQWNVNLDGALISSLKLEARDFNNDEYPYYESSDFTLSIGLNRRF